MKPFIAAALVATLATSAAFAQAAAPTTPATPPAAGAGAGAGAGGAAAGAGASTTTTFTLAAADQTKLKDWITMQKTASVAAPAGVTVAVGSTLPATVMLYPIAASAGVTAVGTNQYAVIDNKIVLVNPTDRKIVLVL